MRECSVSLSFGNSGHDRFARTRIASAGLCHEDRSKKDFLDGFLLYRNCRDGEVLDDWLKVDRLWIISMEIETKPAS